MLPLLALGAAGAAAGLLGGKGKSSAKSTLTSEQKAVMAALGPYLEGQIGQGVEGYEGNRSATLPTWMVKRLAKYAKEVSPYFDRDAQSSAIRSLLSGKPSFDVSPEATKQYWRDGVVNPAMTMWDQDVAPRIKEGYASLGNLYSSRMGKSLEQSLGNLQTNLSAQLAQWQQSNQALQAQLAESAQGRMTSGLAGAQQFGQAPAQAGSAMYGIMGPQIQLQQGALDRLYQEFLRTQPQANPAVGQALQYVGTNTNQLVQQPSMLNQMAGGMSDMLAIGAGAQGLGSMTGLYQSPFEQAMTGMMNGYANNNAMMSNPSAYNLRR